MSFFKNLFNKPNKEEPVNSTDLPWIDPSNNEWGLRLLDLRPVTQTMLSTSKDPRMATNAASYGGENGTCFWEDQPKLNSNIIAGDLSFITDGTLQSGVLFNPGMMEHKWAVYYDGKKLIFVRSWMREVFVVAETILQENLLKITTIKGTFTDNESPDFTRATLSFIVISHALGITVPAPLPTALLSDTNKAGLWAFSTYGNKALIGIFGDKFIPVSKKVLRSHSLLHIAVAQADIEDIENHVIKGMDINALAGDGLGALHWSLAAKSIESMKKLIDLGAEVDIRSFEGATPLMNAAQSNQLDHLNLLLESGADVNAQDHRGFTALHRAADIGYEDMVKILLSNGADKSIETNGHTALSLAKQRSHSTVISLLS